MQTLREDAAAALRRLGHALMAHDADEEMLRSIVELSNRACDQLEELPGRTRDNLAIKRALYPSDPVEGEPISHFSECFVSGAQNPMGVAIAVRRHGEEAVAHVELGTAFEGAPGRAHGGIVAAIFDDMVGYLGMITSTPAFTGELTVRYLAPTPMKRPLEFRAWVDDDQERKFIGKAEATVAGEVIATASAVMVKVPIERFRA